MHLAELLLLSVGLAMDAFAVSVCKGLSLKKATIKHGMICGAWFGGFQGLMPFLGYLLGSAFVSVIDRFAPWVAFIILSLIGINMLKEAFSGEEEVESPDLGFKTMFAMAIATSIDALAVGVTFVAVPVSVLSATVFINTIFACICIAVITFMISCTGNMIGGAFGSTFRSKAIAVGGIILILLGLKMILSKYLGF